MSSRGQEDPFSIMPTPRPQRRFERSSPQTPVSNFEISFPDSSSETEEEEVDDGQLVGEEEEDVGGGPRRLDLVGDDEEEEEVSNEENVENQVEDYSSLFGARSSIGSSAVRRQRLLYEGRENDTEDGKSDVIIIIIILSC
jgi:hypothetical protein